MIFRKKKSFLNYVQDLMKKLEVEGTALLILSDEKGYPIYGNSFFSFSEIYSQTLLNLLEVSDKFVNDSLKKEVSELYKTLNYLVDSVIIRYGSFRIFLIKTPHFHFLSVVDESLASLNLRKYEESVIKTLEKLEERVID